MVHSHGEAIVSFARSSERLPASSYSHESFYLNEFLCEVGGGYHFNMLHHSHILSILRINS